MCFGWYEYRWTSGIIMVYISMHVFWHLSQLYLVAFHQMDLVVFVHTAYGVEHIGPPEPPQAIGVFDLSRLQQTKLQLTKQVNFLTWAAGRSNKEN